MNRGDMSGREGRISNPTQGYLTLRQLTYSIVIVDHTQKRHKGI
jgi:hypothetical protein